MKCNAWNLPAIVLGAGGLIAAIAATTPALGASGNTASGSTVKILSATHAGNAVIAKTIKTIVTLKVPAGHWWIAGKLWADSVPATTTPNTEAGCSITKSGRPQLLDNTIFNLGKTAGNTSAGVIDLSAVITLRSTTTIVLKCADFDTQITTHDAVLTAIGS
jgi:hypothetical protein